MTREEAQSMYESIYAVLPGLKPWLLASAKPTGTMTAWIDSLVACELEDARAVLDDIKFGKEPAPEPWNFGPRFAALCRARSGRRIQAQRDEEVRQQIGQRPLNVMGLVSNMHVWTEYWVPMMDAIEKGTMTREDAFREWERILDLHFGQARVRGVF